MEAGDEEKLDGGDGGSGGAVAGDPVIPFTKCLDPSDYSRLVDELLTVDSLFHSESPQAEQRRWEYALALKVGAGLTGTALDTGGAGSPLVHMLTRAGFSAQIIDPKVNMSLNEAVTLDRRGDYVTCISVIEHVPDLMQFIWDLGQVVKEGGRLFLTTDVAELPDGAPDTKHFSWMRERLFTPKTWQMVAEEFCKNGFRLYGDHEWEWRGEQVYDYSFASLALEKPHA